MRVNDSMRQAQIPLFLPQDAGPQLCGAVVSGAPRLAGAIYETAGRAREYSELACNLYTGCDHGCVYCYVPDVLHRQRGQFHELVKPRDGILQKLAHDAKVLACAGERRPVLLCFATDPYCRADVAFAMTRRAIQILHDAGMRVTILTKGGSRSLRDLDLLGPGDSYGCTLTSLGPAVYSRWEPNAAPPGDRIEALAAFHEAGVPTWVSLEPVLDPGATLEIIRRTAPVVDEFRVGKLNYRSEAEAIDWRTFGREVVRVLERLGKAYYIKKDLRAYM